MPEKLIELFEQTPMKAGKVLVILVLNACARLVTPSAMKLGQDLLAQLSTSCSEHDQLTNSALDMRMKFG